MPLVAGVDSSTSACKVEIRDADSGTIIGSAREPHPVTTPPRSEQDPGAWWQAFEAAFERAAAGRGIDAIAVAGQQHGLVVTGAGGEVLRPAKLWNDTESAAQTDELLAVLGAEAWARACGSVLVPSFTITKLAWLRRTEPEVYDRIERVSLPHDWLTTQLTGSHTTDRGDASGTGWWSPHEERYRFDLLGLVDADRDWAEVLPVVAAPSDGVGRWRGAVVAPGTGDNMAAALGLGLRPGDLALSLGTSGTAFTVATEPSADPSGTVAGFADATGHHLPLVCTLNATKVTAAVARLLGVDEAGLDALALGAPAGAGGLVLVPHLDGERTPNRPGATGAVHGIRSDVTREQFARSAIEGVVCNLLAGADHLPASGTRRLLVGGGARSAAYRQVVADLSGAVIEVPLDDELVARGAAIQAAAVLTGAGFREVSDAWGLGLAATVEPDPGVDVTAVRGAYADAAR